jgi:RimJ/RimL family protein N-acetyltransferase
VRLRDVEPGDVGAYVRMRCDPVMMAELGGPLPREGMAAKVARDVQQAAADAAWIKMIIPGESAPEMVAGSVTLWSHENRGTAMSEIGWMVLPEFQGRGIATTAVRMLLALAREQDRWGLVHAFPAITNVPSNAVCRSAGFRFAGEQQTTFAGRMFRTNHWVINPATDLTTANTRPRQRCLGSRCRAR